MSTEREAERERERERCEKGMCALRFRPQAEYSIEATQHEQLGASNRASLEPNQNHFLVRLSPP